MIRRIIFSVLLTISFLACSDGSSDDDDNGDGGSLQSNACPVLGLNAKIIDGTECSTQNSPVVMLLNIKSSTTAEICSGTMITATDMLTAAHCITSPTSQMVVVAGGRNLNVSRVFIHPDYDRTAIGGTLNDAAIVRLTSNANVPTVPLLLSQDVESDDIISIFGYGLDRESDSTGVLRSGQMRVTAVDSNLILAIFDGEGQNTCSGDSGGPAIMTTSSGASGIVGITSTGTQSQCLEGDNSFFTNAQGSSVADFIMSTSPGVGVI